MNILIVDDQEKILEATKKLVDWDKLHIDKVYTANSAVEARTILLQYPIDIMLTDIEMPGEDGIALQRWQAEEYPSVVSIFLTSHADFFYAKEAIHNGAFDYILQPAGIPEIEEVLGRCTKYLKERELLVRKSSQYDANISTTLEAYVFAMFHQKGKFIQMEEWRKDSNTAEEGWWYLPCLMEVWNADSGEVKRVLDQVLEDICIQDRDNSYITSCLDNREIGILFYAKAEKTELSLMKDKLHHVIQQITHNCDCECNMYLGQYANDDLQKCIGQITDYKSDRLLKKNKVYLVDTSLAFELRKPDGALWGTWLIRGDTDLVKNQISNMLSFAQQEHYLTINYIQAIIHAFLEACSIACYEQGKNLSDLFTDAYHYEQMLHSYSSVTELCEGVDFCLRQYIGMVTERKGGDRTYSVHERIKEILRYLDDNMDRMISRKEASKYVFLNEDYFSRMFRKETGLGFKEYVLKHKMDYAGKLLADTEMPIALIASKVGYENFTNFSQMYKKVTGLSPREYRAKSKNESE